MTPLQLLECTVSILKTVEGRFAVAGGLAAGFYRSQPRATKDVDLLFVAETPQESQTSAVLLLKRLGLTAGLARRSDLIRAPQMNKKSSPVVMVIGRKNKKELESGVDFILPTMPWVSGAIERAQWNLIDFGFAKLPTITPEDLIIAKALAIQDNPTRYLDMDDLQSILQSKIELDGLYLATEFIRHRLSLPIELERHAPKELQQASKRHRKEIKKSRSKFRER